MHKSFQLSHIDELCQLWEKLKINKARLRAARIGKSIDHLGLPFPAIEKASTNVKSAICKVVLLQMTKTMKNKIIEKKEEWLRNGDKMAGNVRRTVEEMKISLERFWKFYINHRAQRIMAATPKHLLALTHLFSVCNNEDGVWIVKHVESSLKQISHSVWAHNYNFDYLSGTLQFFDNFLNKFGSTIIAASDEQVSKSIKWYLVKIELSVKLFNNKWERISFLKMDMVAKLSLKQIFGVICVMVSNHINDENAVPLLFDFMVHFFEQEVNYSVKNMEMMTDWILWIFARFTNDAGTRLVHIGDAIATSTVKIDFAMMLAQYCQFKHPVGTPKPAIMTDFVTQQLGFEGWNWNAPRSF